MMEARELYPRNTAAPVRPTRRAAVVRGLLFIILFIGDDEYGEDVVVVVCLTGPC